MIKAVIYQKDRLLDGFEIAGHADHGPHGQDIVCAAVSMLAITTVNSLLTQIGEVMVKSSEDGMVSCRLPKALDELASVKAQAILKTLEIGLSGVEIEYPNHIVIRKI